MWSNYGAANFEADGRPSGRPGREVAVAEANRPSGTGPSGSDNGDPGSFDDLERRRRSLEATLATRYKDGREGDGAETSGRTGYGQALKLSSEFIAGIAVGIVIGWVIDRFAGTSPWGLIVFLLLGFGAGVLNVLRSAGLIAEAGIRVPPKGNGRPE
jgi:ATP synthase protein I